MYYSSCVFLPITRTSVFFGESRLSCACACDCVVFTLVITVFIITARFVIVSCDMSGLNDCNSSTVAQGNLRFLLVSGLISPHMVRTELLHRIS